VINLAAVRRRLLSLALLLGFVALGCSKRPDSPQNDEKPKPSRLRIAVIPKGTTHEFWKSVHAGAIKAARELDVDIVWKGPLKEDDLKSQIDLVQSFAAQKVSGIALAPLNDKALIASVNAASEAGSPVVIFDSALAGGKIVSFVATDNYAAGRLAATRLSTILPAGGKVAVLRYLEGSASTAERERGFLEGVERLPLFQVVSKNQYAGPTTESAFAAAESLLLAQKAASGGLDAVFAPNESSTFGMLLALEKAKLAGKVRFIGFDVSDKLEKGIDSGAIDALVLQNPFKMGELAVRAVVDHLRGKKVEPRTDTGTEILDKKNQNEPRVRELIKPDLAKWLGP
jgi:ribose transport system substrate-binding protein